jgi:hypothetical protein
MSQSKYIRYKLKREYERIVQQVKGWLMRLYEPILRYRHDKYWDQFVNVLEGQIDSPARKIALLLVYQPNRLAESVLWTCTHLIEQGYAPLIVANGGLLPESVEALKAKSWKLLIRPNTGYDFGGYKDGIRFLRNLRLDIDYLLVMNDSIWFPLYVGDQTLEIMEQSPEDFLGLLERQRTPKAFHLNKSKTSRPFLGSYFWLFKKQTLSHHAFARFWDNYKPTSSKYHTIRNGERLLTPSLAEAGLSYKGLFKMERIVQWLQQLDNPALCAAMNELKKYLNNQDWRNEAMAIIKQITSKNNILAMAPALTVHQFNVGYFKKGSDASGIHALNVFIQGVNDGTKIKQPHPSIWNEMLERGKKIY